LGRRNRLIRRFFGQIAPSQHAPTEPCLFHQTHAVTKSVVQVIREIRAGVPTPPVRRPGRRPADPAAGAVGEPDYAQGPAAVRQLHRQGVSIHGIVRQTGFARNTVRRWLRATPAGEPDRVLIHGTRRGDSHHGRRRPSEGARGCARSKGARTASAGPAAPTLGELGAGAPGERRPLHWDASELRSTVVGSPVDRVSSSFIAMR